MSQVSCSSPQAKTEVLAFEQSLKYYVNPTARYVRTYVRLPPAIAPLVTLHFPCRQNFHMCSVMVGKVDEEGMEM